MVWGVISYRRVGPRVIIPQGDFKSVDYISRVLAGPLWEFYTQVTRDLGVAYVVKDNVPIHITQMIEE